MPEEVGDAKYRFDLAEKYGEVRDWAVYVGELATAATAATDERTVRVVWDSVGLPAAATDGTSRSIDLTIVLTLAFGRKVGRFIGPM